jgi:hypothetical protein
MIDRVRMGLPIDKIANQVLAMRDLWESRSYDFPFFTLGSPAYLDGPSPKYYEDAERLNPVLMEEFQPMYSHVSKRPNSWGRYKKLQRVLQGMILTTQSRKDIEYKDFDKAIMEWKDDLEYFQKKWRNIVK